jgi:hypothetical protein
VEGARFDRRSAIVFAGGKITISDAGREPHGVLLFGVSIAVCFQCPVQDENAPSFYKTFFGMADW